MATRRVLWTLIVSLLLVVMISGGAVVALALFAFRVPTNHLIVLGNDARLRVVGMDGQERVLATDASNDVYRFPAAAPNGRHIAYIARDDNGAALYRLDLSSGERQELYRSQENPPLYLTWSPDGRNISFLSNLASGGLGVHIVPADGSRNSDLISTTRSSSYFAWKPDGSTLLLHIGSSAAQNGRISTYQLGNAQPAQLLDDPGFFQAPAWSTDGSQLFYVAQPQTPGPLSLDLVESVLTRVSSDGTGPTTLASEKQAAIFFSRAPGSNHLAYTTVSRTGFGPLKVVDTATGSVNVVSRADEGVPAFFWSPNGQQLAYLTIRAEEAGQPRFTWHVVARGGGAVQDLVSFQPSEAFTGLVNYFDAYAMSFSLWSPDSRWLTYAAEDGIYVVDVADSRVQRVADGVLALWSGGGR